MLTSSAVASAGNAPADHEAYESAPARAGRSGPARQLLDALLGLLVILLVTSAWVTHVVVCTIGGLWTFLLFGLVLFPVALLHGAAVWLGL